MEEKNNKFKNEENIITSSIEKSNSSKKELTYKDRIYISILDNIMFKKETYRKEVLENEISEEEYNKIIRQGNKVLYDCWYSKKIYGQTGVPIPIYLIIIFLVLMVIAHISILYRTPRDTDSKSPVIIAIILACIVCFVLIVLALYNCLKSPRHDKPMESFYKEKLEIFCDEINKTLKGKSIKFKYDEKMKALSCINENKSKDNSSTNEDKKESNNLERNPYRN